MFINKKFRNLWFSQTLSQLATNIMLFFISFFIYKKTVSNTAVALLILFFLIPSFISSFVAGVVVNRLGKKWVLFFANLSRSLIVLLIFFSEKNLAGLFILIFILALITQFFAPAESAIIPKIVPKTSLIAANAYFSATMNLTLIAGFLASPILLKTLGFNTVFIIFFAYLLSAAAIYFLDVAEPIIYTNLNQPAMNLIKNFQTQLKFTLVNFLGNKKIGSNVSNIIFLQVIIFILVAASPGFADKILRIPVEDLSFLIILPTATGFFIASTIINKLPKWDEKLLIKISHFFMGLIFLGVYLITQFEDRFILNLLNFLLLVGFGFFSGFVMIYCYTSLQRRTPELERAGYFGLLFAFINLASIIPVLLTGVLSDFFGTDKIVLLVASAFILKMLRE